MYYVLLTLGFVFCVFGIVGFIYMWIAKRFSFFDKFKALVGVVLGGLLLWITLPSLKYMIFKEYDVVKGSCTIEIDSSGRSSEAIFRMPDTDEVFSFSDIPELDAYGKAIPYYCEVTVSKDHMFEVDYKIYDAESKELITNK
ncbi:hypothetical protein [Robertmurraya kyonggiensis]|uniref:Uncharacterized protein n=1 Tax=Robertmurraya kyonggiensis TaxID=1037680 RepID=A0A4U1D0I8_9BACI|nr:hypothetical protein [Robertmurraya kyonggiensis]TKC15732.1 hypothetical protein FA727_16550 [Robertmurraya kyonggiensis]